MLSSCKILEFKEFGDERGFLVALEANKNVPFDIKRVYYIYGNKNGVDRGFHAHKNLKQIAVCVSGTCTFILDDGTEKKEFRLDRPNLGLFIDNFIWREMKDFSENCVIMVLASGYYDESDYIRDYDEFLKVMR